MYMLLSVGERKPPCGMPVFNWHVDVMLLRALCPLIDVVCNELSDGSKVFSSALVDIEGCEMGLYEEPRLLFLFGIGIG